MCWTLQDGRRPDEVIYTTQLIDDLARRDFTMNAAAVDAGYPAADRGPALYDPFDGVGDARGRVLRMVGDPAVRLCDDGLRVWRAYRFLDAGPQGLRSLDPSLETALRSPAVQKAAGRASRCASCLTVSHQCLTCWLVDSHQEVGFERTAAGM